MPGKNTNSTSADNIYFSPEQISLLDKINTDPGYRDPVDNKNEAKYRTGLERLINRALSNKCTAQDILNLGVMATRMKNVFSKGKVSELGVGFYDSICKFCNELTGLEKDQAKFQYFETADFFNEEPGYKKKSNMAFNVYGYVILDDEQKLKLLGFREKLAKTNGYDQLTGEAGIIKQEYESFQYNAGEVVGTRILKASTVSSFIDREASACANASHYAFQHNTAKNPNVRAQVKKPDTNAINKLKAAEKQISEIKDAWAAMRDHTRISLFNSTEFNTMERAYKAYVTAYDNLMAGKTLDGKSSKGAQKYSPTQADLDTLRELQKSMQDAAKAYSTAKRAQKGGGIDKHSSKQGADRLAMADILSDFDAIEPVKNQPIKINHTNDINDLMNQANAIENAIFAKKDKVRNVKLSEIDNSPKSGRNTLDEHIRKLEKNEATKQKNRANDLSKR